MNKHISGTKVRMEATFTLNDVVTDPTTVAGIVIDGAGVSTTYSTADPEMTNVSTGVYKIELVVVAEGVWEFRFTGVGVVDEAVEGRFEVPISSFVP